MTAPRESRPAGALDDVLHYHDTTKHHPRRYARSLGYLDWATQPDPFRRYAGAPTVLLLTGQRERDPAYDALFERGAVPPAPLTRPSISQFFEHALAITAWKLYGDTRWSLRANPSSGNLHPTEGYVLVGPVDGLADAPAVYHYAPNEHALERRCEIDFAAWAGLMRPAPPGSFLVGLSSVHWREAWKYGERAFRYCQHDVGHALACVRLAAAMLGWRLRVLDALGDDDVAALLGLDRDDDFANAEREHPDLIALVTTVEAANDEPSAGIHLDAVQAIAQGRWRGHANRLSREHVDWDIIDAVAKATHKPRTAPSAASHTRAPSIAPAPITPALAPFAPAQSPAARRVLFERRSAVAFDGRTSMPAATFFGILSRLLPDRTSSPWDAVPWPPCVHLAMFVHLVEGVTPGLYMLVRRGDALPRLREATSNELDWARPAGCPDALPLYRLIAADCRQAAAALSLGQDIAGDSAFSLGMIAEFDGPLREHGPWFYRRLFWEAGMIGQVLYLEAEAARLRDAAASRHASEEAPRREPGGDAGTVHAPGAGAFFRGTGIGAFFDDSVHDVLGLKGHTFQSLYHFTLGGAVEDTRLTTLPPYGPDVTSRT